VCPPPAVGELRTDAAGVEAADSARVVKRLCEVLQIARSSFYAWLDGEPRRAERAAADAELTERIRVVHERDPTQGGPRITAELNDGAPPVAPVNHKRVARVMREHGITGLRLRRRVRTTVPEPADQKVPDLLNRDFTADAANQRYVGDITSWVGRRVGLGPAAWSASCWSSRWRSDH
jgi:transposase InsO family protein